MIFNAEKKVFGRLASKAAQHALDGDTVIIVNAEKAVITGKKEAVLKKWQTRMKLAPKGNPERGPKFSRMPDRVLRRAVRGMLPNKTTRGKTALRRVKVYIGIPKEYEGKDFVEVKERVHTKRRNEVILGDMCKLLGAKW